MPATAPHPFRAPLVAVGFASLSVWHPAASASSTSELSFPAVGRCPLAGSPAGSSVAAQDAALTPEEFDLFGPSENQNPFVGAASSGAASAVQSPVAKASAPLPGTTYVGPQVAMGLDQNLVVELLRNQQEMLRQNQVLMQSMV